MAKKGVKKSQLREETSETNSSECVFMSEAVDEPKYEKGVVRDYLITSPSPKIVSSRKIHSKERILIAILLVLAVYSRLLNLSEPDSVVFDEVHFGGFARKYILGKFFMDVHPPLAKMMYAAVASLGGFKGDFEFSKIGDTFTESTPYILMRSLPAVLGVATVLLSYLTLRNSGVRPIVAFVTSGLLVVENANVTLSRYILLDSPLIFFIASAVYAFKKFEVQIPFSLGWYKSLIACGIALGLALSSKWVGLFTVAWVGLGCLYQLWNIIGDLSISSKKVWIHFFARGIILLGIPLVLYVLFFAIHFQLLNNDDEGSAFMSSAFRSTLDGNRIPKDILAPVGFGSIVTIRHLNTFGGYLHSHNHFYETGSKQQQITLYPHLDSNNDWIIEPYNDTMPEEFVPITDGTKFRLKHVNTNRRLHSHDEKPPVSERDWQKEVSCYGFEGFAGDANDDFIVEIVDFESVEGEAQKSVRALETVFKLRHAMTGHLLFSTESKLPSWGFEQQEVTCAGQGKRSLTYWYIETNRNDKLAEEEKEIINYKVPTLFEKIVEIHRRMWKVNQGLTEHHNWQSSPSEWPLLLRGINYWVKQHRQVYLMGNAVVWWSATLSIVIFAIHVVFSIFRWQTGSKITQDKSIFNFNVQLFSYVSGWALHYLPFFLMGRQLFLHHYIPALYFGILALGHVFELLVGYIGSRSTVARKMTYGFIFAFLAASVMFYINYSSLIYAQPWTVDKCNASKAMDTWDFDCHALLRSAKEYKDYDDLGLANVKEPAATEAPIEPEIKEAKETPFVPEQQAPALVEEHQSEAKAEEEPRAPVVHEELAPPIPDEGTKEVKNV